MIGAIDFTYANGKKGEEKSLHNLNEDNRYISCLENIGSILDPYSATKKYTFFGFGADTKASEVVASQLNPYLAANNDTNDSFPINGDAE